MTLQFIIMIEERPEVLGDILDPWVAAVNVQSHMLCIVDYTRYELTIKVSGEKLKLSL